MASFKGRVGWKRPRKKENKYCRSFRSYSTRNRKFKKNSKNIFKKLKKYHYGYILCHHRLKEDEKGGK